MAKRVLLVAGREGVAPALQVQIELWGDSLEFTLAASGNEALWEIRGSPYDMVLAPWQLPEMNGMEFAEVVQALSPATRVVLTGVPISPPVQSQSERLHIFALLSETSPQEVAAVISRAMSVSLPRPESPPSPPPPPQAVLEEAPRKKAAAAPKPAPAVAPAPPAPAAAPTPAPAPKVELPAPQQAAVRRALSDLLASVGPQVAFLSDTAGEVLVVQGDAGRLPLPDLAARMVSGLAATGELAQLLSDDNVLGLGLFSGARYDVYAFTVTPATALLLIFDKGIVESKLGSVWLYTRRVVEELRGALS